MSSGPLTKSVQREVALLLALVLFGFVVVPVIIYWLGPRALGDFGGIGFGDFFGSVSERVRSGDGAAWFFILAPYLAIQVLRLTWFASRAAGQRRPAPKV